jgi:hypothetical protein
MKLKIRCRSNIRRGSAFPARSRIAFVSTSKSNLRSAQFDLAGICFQQSQHDFKQRRFPAPFGPSKPHKLPFATEKKRS